MKEIKIFLRKKKKKRHSIVMSDRKIYQKIKKQNLLEYRKKYCKIEKKRFIIIIRKYINLENIFVCEKN